MNPVFSKTVLYRSRYSRSRPYQEEEDRKSVRNPGDGVADSLAVGQDETAVVALLLCGGGARNAIRDGVARREGGSGTKHRTLTHCAREQQLVFAFLGGGVARHCLRHEPNTTTITITRALIRHPPAVGCFIPSTTTRSSAPHKTAWGPMPTCGRSWQGYLANPSPTDPSPTQPRPWQRAPHLNERKQGRLADASGASRGPVVAGGQAQAGHLPPYPVPAQQARPVPSDAFRGAIVARHSPARPGCVRP